MTVRDVAGQEVTIEATRRTDLCEPEGSLYWTGPDAAVKGVATALGEGPFIYQVTMVLDGTEYDATARWPADQIVGNEPSAALTFAPPLPALQPNAP